MSLNRELVDSMPIYAMGQRLPIGKTKGRLVGKVEFTCRQGCTVKIETGFDAFLNKAAEDLGLAYAHRHRSPAPSARPEEEWPEWPEGGER